MHWYEYKAKKKCKKNGLEKDFSKLMNNALFRKTMEKARNQKRTLILINKPV